MATNKWMYYVYIGLIIFGVISLFMVFQSQVLYTASITGEPTVSLRPEFDFTYKDILFALQGFFGIIIGYYQVSVIKNRKK